MSTFTTEGCIGYAGRDFNALGPDCEFVATEKDANGEWQCESQIGRRGVCTRERWLTCPCYREAGQPEKEER